jgi:Ca2+-binding EF-hand superfamily protein
LTIDKIFKTVDDDGKGVMDITEFNEVVTLCYTDLKKHEIDSLFQHFDKNGVGRLTKDEF